MTSTLQFKSQIKLDRLIQHVMIFDLPSFTVKLNFSSMFSKTGQLCNGLGWTSDQIVVKISTQIELEECSKYIVNDITDWRASWTGEDA